MTVLSALQVVTLFSSATLLLCTCVEVAQGITYADSHSSADVRPNYLEKERRIFHTGAVFADCSSRDKEMQPINSPDCITVLVSLAVIVFLFPVLP